MFNKPSQYHLPNPQREEQSRSAVKIQSTSLIICLFFSLLTHILLYLPPLSNVPRQSPSLALSEKHVLVSQGLSNMIRPWSFLLKETTTCSPPPSLLLPKKIYGEMQDVPTVLNPFCISNLGTSHCVCMEMCMQMDAYPHLPNSGYK